jgi:hypothetical protein
MTWREDMRTLRLSLVGTVILVLLGGLGGASLAQMDEDADAVYVTVTAEPREADAGSVVRGDPLYRSRDGVNVYDLEASDPRLTGTFSAFWNVDVDIDTQHGVMWGTTRIENDGGTWEGPFTGMEYEAADGGLFATSGVMVGGDEYAGYAFYYQLDARQHSGVVDRWHGVVYKGQPPELKVAVPTRNVVIGAGMIEQGTSIGLEMLTVWTVPIDETNEMALTDPALVCGRTAAIDILPNQPIAPNMLVPE